MVNGEDYMVKTGYIDKHFIKEPLCLIKISCFVVFEFDLDCARQTDRNDFVLLNLCVSC